MSQWQIIKVQLAIAAVLLVAMLLFTGVYAGFLALAEWLT